MEERDWTPGGARLRFLEVKGLEPGGALSPAEAQRHSAFRMEKRRSEWLAGRLAAKQLLAADAGLADLAAFEIGMDRYGRPCCGERLVSISHSNGWAMAAFKPGSAFLGADLEKVESRHPAWYRDYFRPSELRAPDPSEATRLWAVKEAVMKALGLGLMADPLEIEAGASVRLYGRALARYEEMGRPPFKAESRPFPGGFWTAVAA